MEELARDTIEGKMGIIKESNVDPAWLAGELLPARIIDRNDMEKASNVNKPAPERLGELFLTVTGNGTPGVFQALVGMFLRKRPLKWLGDGLKADFISAGGVWNEESTLQMLKPSQPFGLIGPTLSDRPKIAQLQTLKGADGKEVKIIEYVAAHWTDIAIAMDFDDTGQIQTTIREDYNDAKKRCEAVFRIWLEGKGSRQPATWGMLIKILKDCNLNALADDITKLLNMN